MINEISHNIAGVQALQSKGNSERVGGVQKQSAVNASDQTKPSPRDIEGSKPAPQLLDQELGEAVENLNQYVQSVKRQLEFSVDKESGKTVIKVIDADTGETIRDIPAEEVLNMQKKLKETSDQLFHREDSGVSVLFQGKA